MSANCRLLLPIFFSFILAFPIIVRARVLAGPLIGQVDLRTARIRVEAQPGDQVSTGRHQEIHSSLSQSYVPVIFGLVNLQFCTIYEYSATIDHKSAKRSVGSDGSFSIKEIWRWSMPTPDFNFPAGACACFS